MHKDFRSRLVVCLLTGVYGCVAPGVWGDDGKSPDSEDVSTTGFPNQWKTDTGLVRFNSKLQEADGIRGRFMARSPKLALQDDFVLACEHRITSVGKLEIHLVAARREMPVVIGIGSVEFAGVSNQIVPAGGKRTLRFTRTGSNALVTIPGMEDIHVELGQEFSNARIDRIDLVFQAGRNSNVEVFSVDVKSAAKTMPPSSLRFMP